MADASEINILVNELNSIKNKVIGVQNNPNISWDDIREDIATTMGNIHEVGQQVDEDDILMMMDDIGALMNIAADAAEEENSNGVSIALEEVIDALNDVPIANENMGGYRKRKQRTHRKHRTQHNRKRRTHRKRTQRNRKRRTHRNRK